MSTDTRPLDLGKLADRLEQDAAGIWRCPGQAAVSYPAEGNDLCFQLEDKSFWFQHRNRVLQELVRQFPPGAGPFLDVGGGNGYVARGLAEVGLQTILVEPGPSGARHAIERGLSNVVCATLEDAAFHSGSVGGIGLFDVLEHIQDDEAFLRKLAPVLAADGRLYLTVPAFGLLWSSDDVYAGHYRRYNRGNLTCVLRAAGFVVEYVTCFFWLLPAPVFLLRSLPTRLGLRRKLNEATAEREHELKNGRIQRAFLRLLNREIGWIRARRSLPVGGSILAVARRR